MYFNDGKGNFKIQSENLPQIRQSGSCIAVCDFDKDGDLDVFRGGMLAATQFPLAGTSYSLQNNRGKFRDITQIISSEIQKIGMVTDAIWADIDNDSWQDLV